MYRSIFIDLDDTVWAFTENARDTFQDMYDKYHFDRYFRSFSHFYTLYSGKNEELWNEYGAGRITKDELNEQRFAYPLLQVGVADKALVKAYSDNFFDDIVYKKKLMPHAREALEYLASAYNLYILSNGFRELQEQKMRSAGVEGKHPIKYTIPNITKAAIPIVGYAAFAIYSHSFFHLCGSICSSSSFVAFCIYGILAITSFR